MGLPAGTQLGRYTVLKPLARGGMAEVLLARAEGMVGFAHHVVIKCIHANKSTDPEFITAFLDEARLAGTLHHHHIVQVHEVGRENNDYFFSMEYVHGEDLRKLLTRVARMRELVPLEHVITIVLAVAAALHHAHEQRAADGEPLNLVHRDVTPANILVGYDGNVKVGDFGIAKAALRSTQETRTGTMRGKVAYMAPEQCLGRPIDRRSDIYALGIVLYELCTSRRLFKGETDFLTMSTIVAGKIPKPTDHRKEIPLDLEDVILKALAPSPELRFSTGEELALALERVAAANQIRISPKALSDYMGEIFGVRPEPWLSGDDTGLEVVDVDFDGEVSGLVELSAQQARDLDVAKELADSPILATPHDDAGGYDDEFADEARTELVDLEIESPTLNGGNVAAAAAEAARLLATPPPAQFDGNEATAISEGGDLDVLLGMSKIEARAPEPEPEPTEHPTPVTQSGKRPGSILVAAPRDATPFPARRDATPVPAPIPPRDATPIPVAPALGMMPPPRAVPVRAATPYPGSSPAAPAWGSTGSATGTPMAWANDGEVPSLRPNSRRIFLIAAVAIPLVVIGLFALTRGHDDGVTPARTVEPDALVAPIDAALPDAPAPVTPTGSAGSAAETVVPATAADTADHTPPITRPAVKPKPKPPVRKPARRPALRH